MRFLTSTLLLLTVAAPVTAQSKPTSQPQSHPTSKRMVAKPSRPQLPNPHVLIKTSMGDITLELFINETPKTVANFIGLAEGTKEFTDPKTQKKVTRPFYDGLVFHRVISKFMAQGGCPLGNGTGSPGFKFEDEINAEALNLHKVIAFDKGRAHPLTRVRSQRDFQQYVIGPMIRRLGIKSQEDFNKRKAEVDKALKAFMVKPTMKSFYENQGYKYDMSRASHRMLRGTIAMANSGPNTNGSQFFINMKDNEFLNGKHTVFGKVLVGMEVVDKMANAKTDPQDRPTTPIKIVSVRTCAAPKVTSQPTSRKNG